MPYFYSGFELYSRWVPLNYPGPSRSNTVESLLSADTLMINIQRLLCTVKKFHVVKEAKKAVL